MSLESKLKKTQDLFDRLAPNRARWKKKNWYYYDQIRKTYAAAIPAGARILEVGSGDGDLLSQLKPSYGVGIDASPVFVDMSRKKYPHLHFQHGFAETLTLNETFDYIILPDLVGYLEDVQLAFMNLKPMCKPSTRIIINYYNYLWEPILKIGDILGFRMKQKIQNWLSLDDLQNLLQISGFDVIKKTRKLIFPIYIPLISNFMNRVVANLPLIRKLCLVDYIIARPAPEPMTEKPSVSILVACRNEKGNIEDLVRRLSPFPAPVEMIFVDGFSNDGTGDEVLRVAKLFPEKNIRLFQQTGPKGKGHAIRQAFDEAKNDVFIILDADISVAPEDMRKFYDLMVKRTGECVSGTRMVYQMEKQAMRFLNILGNKFFSLMFTFLLDQKIKDTLCGTKALLKEDYEKIKQNRAFFGDFDPFGDFDILFGAAKLNLKMVEIPVRYYERQYGTTKIHRFRHGFLLLGMCFIAMRKIKFV